MLFTSKKVFLYKRYQRDIQIHKSKKQTDNAVAKKKKKKKTDEEKQQHTKHNIENSKN